MLNLIQISMLQNWEESIALEELDRLGEYFFFFLNKKPVLLPFLNKPKGITETDKGYKTPLHL
jgi:hypothetical protein